MFFPSFLPSFLSFFLSFFLAISKSFTKILVLLILLHDAFLCVSAMPSFYSSLSARFFYLQSTCPSFLSLTPCSPLSQPPLYQSSFSSRLI